MKKAAVILLGGLIVVLTCAVASVGAVYDDFNDNSLNTSLWHLGIYGQGVSVAERNGRIEITLLGNSVNDPRTGSFSAGIYSNLIFTGDYDIQVDYELLVWPPRNGVRIAMNTGDSILRISRGNEGTPANLDEKYETTSGQVATTDRYGTLRQVRVNGYVTGYYLHDGSWVQIAAPYLNAKNFPVSLSAWSHENVFPDQDVVVSFDNLIINQGQIVPEPSSLLALLCGIGGLGGVIRRRKRST